ncbi:MAG: dTMP kinase [Planctomycetota bacterium]
MLEGPDGAGKSTQAAALEEALQAHGYEVVRVREPGGTQLGEGVRALLLQEGIAPQDRVPICDLAELFLFLASRAQLTERVIRPALARGAFVLADRFFASSVVYQGFANGTLGGEGTLALCLQATQGLLPDATVLLQLSAETARARVERADEGPDRIESRAADYFDKVVRGYEQYRDLAREPVIVIDADRPATDITRELVAAALGVARGAAPC